MSAKIFSRHWVANKRKYNSDPERERKPRFPAPHNRRRVARGGRGEPNENVLLPEEHVLLNVKVEENVKELPDYIFSL